MTKKILFIIGSLRKKSFNRQLAAKCREILEKSGNVEITELDFSDVPFMNQDVEMNLPTAVSRVRTEVAAADGIWIFTPEYNYAIPGVLKNLLDWLSRPLVPGDFASGTAAAGKKVTMSGVGGKNATQNVRADLKKLLDFIEVLAKDKDNAWFVKELGKRFGVSTSVQSIAIDIKAIRDALHIKGNNSLHYDYISNQSLRNQLLVDNLRIYRM